MQHVAGCVLCPSGTAAASSPSESTRSNNNHQRRHSEKVIYRSLAPHLEIPDLPLHEFIYRESLPHYADDVALVDGTTGHEYTYQQLHDFTQNVAAGLNQHGLRQGEVLCIYSHNCPEYVIALHAVSVLGAVTSPCSPLYPADSLAHQLVDSGSKYIITVPAALPVAKEAARKAGGIRTIFVFGPESEGAVSFSTLMHASGRVPRVVINPREDTALLPYSSGTTSLPKGVILTHRNLVANLLQIAAMGMIHERDVLVGVLPFFHIYANTAVVGMGLIRGAKIVCMPKFDLQQFLEIIQNHKVTFGHIVPPIALALAKHPLVDKYDLSSVRGIMSGAAPMSADTEEEIKKRLRINVKQGYGMTELSPVTHMSKDGDPGGTIGVLVPNCYAMIIKEDGSPARIGEDGELCVKGPNVMKGYLNNPSETANCIDADGFLHTGDVARMDARGYYYIVDRVKELIKYKGFQVPPAELEALLLTHPAVADAAVIGVPNEEAGELPKAFIVLKQGQSVDAKGLMEWMQPKVPHYKLLRGGIEFVSEIPKSASGKILRRFLRDKEKEKLKNAKL